MRSLLSRLAPLSPHGYGAAIALGVLTAFRAWCSDCPGDSGAVPYKPVSSTTLETPADRGIRLPVFFEPNHGQAIAESE